MKTLQDICRAYPLKVRYARVHIECRSDYNDYTRRRDTIKMFVNYPLEMTVDMWKYPLDHVERREVIHRYTNDELIQEATNELVSQTPEDIKTLVPNIETLVYNALEIDARNQIKDGKTSEFMRVDIEHQTYRIMQVYIPGYHAEYGGQSIDVEPELLWENPNYWQNPNH